MLKTVAEFLIGPSHTVIHRFITERTLPAT